MRNQDTTLPPNGVMGVYSITNTASGAQYIGSSNNVRQRLNSHISLLRKQRHPVRDLQADWDRTSPDAFVVALLETVERPELLSPAERRWCLTQTPIYNTNKPLSRRRRMPPVYGGQPRTLADIPDLTNLERRFWRKVERGDAATCWLWQGGLDRNGYGSFSVSHRTAMRAHRMAYLLTHGSLDADCVLRHACDRPACCNAAHLEPGTHADNRADTVRRGRVARGDRSGSRLYPERLRRGEEVGNSRLTVAAVHTIRRLAAQGMSQRKIAREVGISQPVVGKVIRREAWAHVPPEAGEATERLPYVAPRGADHWCALLNRKQRADVVKRFTAGGVTQAQLATALGVSTGTIGQALEEANARPGRSRPGPSGIRGVHYNPHSGCRKHWVAMVYVQGRSHHVGRYATREQAAVAVEAYRRDVSANQQQGDVQAGLDQSQDMHDNFQWDHLSTTRYSTTTNKPRQVCHISAGCRTNPN